MTKIFLATPAYDGKVHVPYAIALSETHTLLARNNIQCVIRISCSGSLLVAERNRLIRAFLETDCTHMLFIDSDLGWPPQAVLAMLQHDEEFVAGIYPTRKDNLFLFRPVLQENGSVVVSEKKLLEMNYIPAGFMLLKRSAIEKMMEKFPELKCTPKAEREEANRWHCLFNTEVFEGEFWGEDYVFCRRARESGIKIWVDPLIEFDHAGIRGMMASCLTDDKSKSNSGGKPVFLKKEETDDFTSK